MPYLPTDMVDVFISYCHDDDFVWIERFQQELKTALIRKLRARIQPRVFLDLHDVRAGRMFDEETRNCLAQTTFFLAMVSPRYNGSEFCRYKELTEFLRHHPPASGRLIQVKLDLTADLPVAKALAVPFAGPKGLFRPDSEEYADGLRRICEPIVAELDRLYASSSMIFLAWPEDLQLQEERQRLKLEIESRNLRVFPVAVAEYEDDVRLRDALHECTTSVHFFSRQPQGFDLRQWQMAVQLNKPCIIASQNPTELRRGPAGSPSPVYLGHGNPTIAIANAVEQIVGIERRADGDDGKLLCCTPVFLSFKEDSDASVGLKLRKRIISRGSFEVIVPPLDRGLRFEEFSRAKAALVCRPKADFDWLTRELRALNSAMVASQRFDIRRAVFLPDGDGAAGLDILEEDAILRSEEDLDVFLRDIQE